jgi:hypothetical protein
MLKQEILRKHNSPSKLHIKNTWYIHDIYQLYAWYMPYVYQVQRSLSFASFQRSNQCGMNCKYIYAAWRFRTTTRSHSKGMIYCQTGYTRYIYGIYHVYAMHIPCDGHLRASLVAHPRLEASDRDFRRSFSVLATERSPTRGWGRPKFDNQVLIS